MGLKGERISERISPVSDDDLRLRGSFDLQGVGRREHSTCQSNKARASHLEERERVVGCVDGWLTARVALALRVAREEGGVREVSGGVGNGVWGRKKKQIVCRIFNFRSFFSERSFSSF